MIQISTEAYNDSYLILYAMVDKIHMAFQATALCEHFSTDLANLSLGIEDEYETQWGDIL